MECKSEIGNSNHKRKYYKALIRATTPNTSNKTKECESTSVCPSV